MEIKAASRIGNSDRQKYHDEGAMELGLYSKETEGMKEEQMNH